MRFISEDANADIQEIAGIMLTQMLDEMKEPDDARSFLIIDYILGLPELEWVEEGQFWTVEVSVDVLYDGILSPIGPKNAEAGEYYSIDIGRRKLTKDGNTYKMEMWLV